MNFVQIGTYDNGATGHILNLETTAKVIVSEPESGRIDMLIGGVEVALFISRNCLLRPDNGISLVTVHQFTEED